MDGNGIVQSICLQQGNKAKNLLRGEEEKASELSWDGPVKVASH